MFLPLKRPMGLALVAMLLLAVSPAVLAADDAPDRESPTIMVMDWIGGAFDALWSLVDTGSSETEENHPGQGDPQNPPEHEPDMPGPALDNPGDEAGPGLDPGPP